MGEIGDYWRDVKADRKRRQQEREERAKRKASEEKQAEQEKAQLKQQTQQKLTQPPRRHCWDWIVVGGNCHFAKNRSSFTTYRQVRSTAGNGLG